MNQYPELLTIKDFLRFATSRFNEAGLFFGHGTDNALDEAIALILPSLHLPYDVDTALLETRLVAEERQKILHLLNERLQKRIPVAYLTHQAWFCGLSIYVDERVLIPRSSIAELIDEHFTPWVNPDQVTAILDLCTGSACIAIACAKAFPQARIVASDISKDALSVAEINVLRHQVEHQVELIESDLYQNIPQEKFDIIISNPPYVSAEEMASLPEEYQHEPTLGLSGGEEGLDFVKRILKEAHNFLKPNGILVVEVGNAEMELIEQYPEIPFTWLDFERSDGGVFLLHAQELANLKI